MGGSNGNLKIIDTVNVNIELCNIFNNLGVNGIGLYFENIS